MMKKLALPIFLVFLCHGIKLNGQGVGVNTTSPKSMLDVEGNVAIGVTYSGTTAAPTNGAIIEGNVGIGTSAAANRLVVEQDGTTLDAAVVKLTDVGSSKHALVGISSYTTTLSEDFSTIRAARLINTSGAGIGVSFNLNDANGDLQNYAKVTGIIEANDAASVDGTLGFFTRQNGAINRNMTILSNGYVGFKETTPDVPLHITTNSASTTLGWVPWAGTQMLLQMDDASDNNGLVMSMVGRTDGNVQLGFGDRDAQLRGRIVYDNGLNLTDAMTFWTANTAWVNLLSDGKFGIGDADADARLEVSVDAGAQDYFMLSSDDNNDGDIMVVKNSGFVGVGTTAPDDALLHLEQAASGTATFLKVTGSTDDHALNIYPIMKPTTNIQAQRMVAQWDPQAAGLTLYGLNMNNYIGGSTSNGIGTIYNFHAQFQTWEAYNGVVANYTAFIANGYAANGSSGSPSVTNYIAFQAVDPVVDGTALNYGFYGQMNSGAGKYNLHLSGTADNYMNGDLGIFTSDPESSLHIKGANGLATTGARLEGTIPTFKFKETNGNTNENFQVRLNDGQLKIQTNDDAFGSAATVITVRQDGRTGFGVTEPQEILHLDRGTAHTTIQMDKDDNTVADIMFRYLDSAQVRYGTDENLVLQNYTLNKDIGMYVDKGGSTYTALFLEGASGFTGIGTGNPQKQLHVYGSVAADKLVKFHNASTATTADGLLITIGPATNPGTDNDYIIFQSGNGTVVGSIDGNGGGAIAYNTTSDRRRKQNIENLDNALDMVMNIQARTYEFKTAPGLTQTGFIAQELQTVYPDAVSGTADGDPITDPMSVDYSRLTPLLTGAVQELKNEKDQDVASLKLMIEKLQLRISNLEKSASAQ